ncbi:hypothetical protein LOZ67_003559 [Ophidiomyces ophidiicola]|nr:hypothetical protein LOZ67_003559 [Ophidiomyces ophidiicola]
MSESQEFTVFVRLPFERGVFVDPPPPDWTTSKDQALWDVLLQPSKGIDCKECTVLPPDASQQYSFANPSSASRLDVTLPFLLQQAAWLYGHRLAQVRAEMRKAGNQQPLSASQSGSQEPSGYPMVRGRSGESSIPLRVSNQSPGSRADADIPSGDPSQNVPAGIFATSRANPSKQIAFRKGASNDVAQAHNKYESYKTSSPLVLPAGEESPELPLSSSESESDGLHGPKLPFKRLGKFSLHKASVAKVNKDSCENEDEETSPAFLPIKNPSWHQAYPSAVDPGATLREEPENAAQPPLQQDTAASTSTISSGIGSAASGHETRRKPQPLGPLSPRRTAELATASPRNRTRGSDGTPSMGSSFSDLDDNSVTQSALEEALLSNMQKNGVGSRMSTLSQALRSKYL